MLDLTYINDQLKTKSLLEICKDRQWKYSTTYYVCKKNGIPLSRKRNGKSTSTHIARKQQRRIPDDKVLLTQLYVTERKTLQQIGDIFETTRATVSAALRRNGISVRLKNGKAELKKPTQSKEVLTLLYWNLKLSLQEICERLGYKHHGEVCEELKYHNIKRRTYKEAGTALYEKHPEKRELHREQFYAGITGPKENHVTSLEQAFIDWANDHNIRYDFQFQIRENWHRYDFKIVDTKVIVEMDGDYWHSLPEYVERDAKFDLTAERHGFQVIRIKQSELKENPNIFDERIIHLMENK